MQLTPDALRILAQTVMGEARGEGYDGMRAIAHVIRNRASSGRYPSDPVSVALQPAQFSAWNRGEGGNNPGRFGPGTPGYQDAVRAVQAAFSGQSQDPTGGATHYWAPGGMDGGNDPYWARSEQGEHGRIRHGGHIFLAQRPVSDQAPGNGLSAIAAATGIPGTPIPRPASAYAPAGVPLDTSMTAPRPIARPDWLAPPVPRARPAGLGSAPQAPRPMPRPASLTASVAPRPPQLPVGLQRSGLMAPVPPIPPQGLQRQPPRPVAPPQGLQRQLVAPVPPQRPGSAPMPRNPATRVARGANAPSPVDAYMRNASSTVGHVFQEGEGDGLPPVQPTVPFPFPASVNQDPRLSAAMQAQGMEVFDPTSLPRMPQVPQPAPVRVAQPPQMPLGPMPQAMPPIAPQRPPMATFVSAQGNQPNPIMQSAGNVGNFVRDYATKGGLPGMAFRYVRDNPPRAPMFSPDRGESYSTAVRTVGPKGGQQGFLSTPGGATRNRRLDKRDQSSVDVYRANRTMVRNVLGEDARLTASNLQEAIRRGGTGYIRR